jgi:hypothetical protein
MSGYSLDRRVPEGYEYGDLTLWVGGVSHLDSKIWSCVPLASGPTMTALARTSSICKLHMRLIVREGAPHLQTCNCQNLVLGSQMDDWLQHRLADWPSVVTWLWLWLWVESCGLRLQSQEQEVSCEYRHRSRWHWWGHSRLRRLSPCCSELQRVWISGRAIVTGSYELLSV